MSDRCESGTERWTFIDSTGKELDDRDVRRPERDPPEPEMGTLEGPLYYVETGGGLPDLMFGRDDYEQAYEMATGERIDGGGHDGEERIHLWDVSGTVEVPIADV